MKVLVTGGCGMIGFHAAKYYKTQGHHVDVIDNLERSKLLGHEVSYQRKVYNKELLKDLGISYYPYDVSEESSFDHLEGHDIIIHMAAQCGVPTSIANPRRDFEVNVQGTFNVLEYARKHNSTVIYASTNKVYPIHGDNTFVKYYNKWYFKNKQWANFGFPVQNDLIGARTPYGWSKYAGDLLCQEFSHTYGLRTGVFRMSCIYGTNQFGFEEQGWATWFCIAAKKKLPIVIFGDGCQTRDMLYVTDAIEAYDQFVKSDFQHAVFNLGGGPENTLSLNNCIETIQNRTGHKFDISYKDWRPLDQKSYVTDIRELASLGWAPTVTVGDGLQKVLDWVEDNKEIF